TGVGLDNFFANYFFYSSHWDGLNHAVHSTWFGVLAETGFLGLIVFLGFITSLILSARKTLAAIAQNPNQYSVNLTVAANAVYAGLLGTIVSGTFLTQGFNWPIYILAALTVAVANIAQNSSQNENQ
ncbi:O-antigen ligase family protein, partial [Vibrio genomosp. F10 str. 9ZD137]